MTEIEELVRDREYWIERVKQKDETISVIRAEMERLREELEKVSKERDEALAEVEKLKGFVRAQTENANYWRDMYSKQQIANRVVEKQSTPTRPEPSRLEIAATLLAASMNKTKGCDWVIEEEVICALEDADKLIAAAKEEVGK